MQRLGLLKSKHIPAIYLCNSREVRLEVLAGLIDTDGWTNHGGYQIIQKSEILADDICYLARSLGLAAYKEKRTKYIKSRGFSGPYYWVGISGDCSVIPVRLPRKKVAPRVQGWKDHLVTGVEAIRDAGYGEYYGFQLDGDGRFLMGDFTVTHNTTLALMTLYTYALRQPPQRWPLVVACVRDTRANIGITTVPSIKEWWPDGIMSQWTGKEFAPEVATILGPEQSPLLRFHFFGCDSNADMNRFQSFECDVLYVEEPAPAAGVSGGISGDTVGVAITSQRRETLALCVIATNPPDGDHWVAQVWGLAGATETDWDVQRQGAIDWIRERSCVIELKPGDNTALTARQPEYRERNRQVLTAFGRTDLVARLVEGTVGTVQEGVAVASNFTAQHVVEACPPVPPGARLVASWDPRHSPAGVLWRPLPGGHCHVLAAWQGVNMGVRQLITRTIQPWLALHVGHSDYTIIHTGDPNTMTEDQSDSALSATKVILALLGGAQWVPGPVGVEERRLPMHDCLNMYVNGRPWLMIDKRHCQVLIQALSGRWHYPKDPSGRVIKDQWKKDQASDVGEAFAYGCWLLQRRKEERSTMDKWRARLAAQTRERHASTGVGSGTGA